MTSHRKRRREEEEEMAGVKKIKGDEERLQGREKGEKMVVRFVGRREAVVEGECEGILVLHLIGQHLMKANDLC